ncbi:MAG: hypothetical protein M3Q44_07805 [bacterium]|nr:hypothetical protein [bacterium]
MNDKSELIFVYNADSGVFAGIKDLVHKSVSPKTYGCNLCGLTYGGVSMKQDWKQFIESLPVKVTFLHKDEFAKQYPKYALAQFPAAFKKDGAILDEYLSAEEINKQNTLEDLKKLVETKISKD